MKKKIELPINTDVPIYTYSYYGFPLCIITADEHISKYIANIEVFDYDQYTWNEQYGNFEVEKENGKIQFYSKHPYKEQLNGVMSRRIANIDAIHVKINYLQYSHPWGAVNLFIDNSSDDKLLLGDDEYMYRLGYFNWEGVYFRTSNAAQKLEINNREFPIELMLCRDHQIVEAYLFLNNRQYLLSQKIMDKENERGLKIGIQLKGAESTYYHWLFRNFIQISCDINNMDRPIDFFYGVEKNWRYDWVNYNLNSSEMSIQFINKYGALRFIRECIDRGSYIELLLDQYHIADRLEYQTSHFMHQNLIYGYDDKEKRILLLGYSNNGKIVKTSISYADIKYQFTKKKCSSQIYLITYQQDSYAIQYDADYIIKMLHQYLGGYNSSKDLGFVIQERERVYGIKCYEELLTEEGIELILQDRRVLHLLYEHKLLMKERIEYLNFHNAIISAEYEKIRDTYTEIIRIALNIRNLSVKYMINGDKKIICSIKSGLTEMMNTEKAILEKLLLCMGNEN